MSVAPGQLEIQNQVFRQQTVHGSLNFGPVTKIVNHGVPVDASSTVRTRDSGIIASLAFPQMLEQRNNIDQPHGNTCSWIFKLDEYNEWEAQSRGLLWIKGKPGAGKSTLMFYLYRRRRERRLTNRELNLDFFFTARGVELQRTPLGMLRSLLNQLFNQDASIRPAIRDVYEEKCVSFGHDHRSWEWQRPELEQLLSQAILASARHRQIVIFIDAIDEAGAKHAGGIVHYLHHMYDRAVRADANLKLCIASRHYPVLSVVRGLEITVERHNGDDIEQWIHGYLGLHTRESYDGNFDLCKWRELKQELIEKARGVFQWVRLVTPILLKDIHDGISFEGAKIRLANNPEELEDIYAHIIRTVIERQFRAQSFLFFIWVCFAERPLSVAEMRYALAEYNVGSLFPHAQCCEMPGYGESDEVMRRRVEALSGGLVEIIHDPVNHALVISVFHQSVKEFLITKGLRLLAHLLCEDGIETSLLPTANVSQVLLVNHCHTAIYWCCLQYFAVERLRAIEDAWDRLRRYPDERATVREGLASSLPLAEYGALFMFLHAEKSSNLRSKSIPKELEQLKKVFSSWSKAHSIFRKSPGKILNLRQNLLHVTAGADMVVLVMDLLKNGPREKYSVDQKDEEGFTPLHYASERGHERTCEILLQAGAEIDTPSRLGATPIILAAGKGHLGLVKWLLSNGADVDNEIPLHERQSVGPLYAAAIEGHAAVVRILIDAGADVNKQRGYGTPLEAAILKKHDKIVQMLLDAGANPSLNERGPSSALHTAAEHGTEGAVQLLLNAGVDVNIRAGIYVTALQAASVSGNERTVRILLDAGADVNAQGGVFGTALQAAAASGKDNVLRMLLNAGADMSIEGGKFGSVFRAAAHSGSTEIAQTFLEFGTDINKRSEDLGTALQAAAASGTRKTVRFLLDSGADPNVRGGIYGTVLQATAHAGNIKIARMLLDAGADVNAQGGEYHTALQAASSASCPAMVQMLVDAGADPNITGGAYHSALQAAAAQYGDNRAVVRILLAAGADVHVQGGDFGSAMEAAKAYGVREVVELLAEAGAGTDRDGIRPKKEARIMSQDRS